MVGGKRVKNRVRPRFTIKTHGQTIQIPDPEDTLGFQILGVYLDE